MPRQRARKDSKHPRVLVAMSGGLDSAVTAALLVQQGYEVTGATLEFWHECGYSPAHEARDVCIHLGIPHITLDARQQFYNQVVTPFISEYAQGRTPNPCVYCNPTTKFGVLLAALDDLGLNYLATGHYAKILQSETGWELHRGMDERKDQSYFLHRLNQRQLGRILFPLGELAKDRVRILATELSLPNAEKAESQDLCFSCDGDYRRFVAEHAPQAFNPGPILDKWGNRLGTHQGLAAYTIGQRGGLGVSAPAALYVLELDPLQNAVIVGYIEELGRSGLVAENMAYIEGITPQDGSRFEAQIRYQGKPTGCTYYALGAEAARIEFDTSLRDITPGQAVVLYEGSRVIGGGIIAQST